jgi:drug/metabolite transporter (DMT)-like permease
VLIAGQIGGTLLFGIVMAPIGWIAPSLGDLALMSLFGVLSIIALACVNRALKLTAASVVVPYPVHPYRLGRCAVHVVSASATCRISSRFPARP